MLPNSDALSVALALARDGFDLAAAGLRAEIKPNGQCRLVDPVVRSKRKGPNFHAALVAALQAQTATGGGGRRSRGTSTEDVSGLILFPQAAFALAATMGAEVSPPTPEDDLLFFAPDGPDSAARITDVLRMGRHGALLSAKSLTGDPLGTFIRVDDSDQEYGFASALIGRDDFAETLIPLSRASIGERTLWIGGPGVRMPPVRALAALGQYCAVTEALAGKDFAWLQTDASAAMLAFVEDSEAAVPAVELVGQQEPLQRFDLTLVSVLPDTQAAKALADRIAEENYRLGYRVAFQAIRSDLGAGLDVGPLLEQIEDLKLQIAQIQALGAPQTRLLRFSDAQLPAMIDALRRIPEARLNDGSIRYAAGHSAGIPEPSHYLMYDLSQAPARVFETLWRGLDPGRPMSYWLDPFVAERRQHVPAKSSVYVPENLFLVPSLAHFADGTDETLRRIIGSLFVDLKPFLADDACRPMYVFTPVQDQADTIQIEVLDERSFAPLQQQIGWMNDYLQVRSPGLVDRETLRLLAEELYEGDFVESVRATLDGQVAQLSGQWRDATDQLRNDAIALIDAHTAEIGTVSDQIVAAQAWLTQADRKMADLEQLLTHADKALRESETAVDALVTTDNRMIQIRAQFEARVGHELARSEKSVDAAQQRLDRLRARVHALRNGDAR